MTMSRRRFVATGVLSVAPWTAPRASAQGFDHDHAGWTALLRRHVLLLRGGQASQLRYAGLAQQRTALRVYLDTLSGVDDAAFQDFSKAQQQAFLINAYNAFTAELVLTKYPDLKSIKDLARLLSTPWKPKWVALRGAKVSLDDIEHGMLRERGRFDDPRVHFAANCASVGCPMLREEAYQADRLDAQLEQQAQRFMADSSRNRWNAQRGRLELSRIFDWYAEDFRLGHRGIRSVAGFAARHADLLADTPADREHIRSGQAEIAFLDYDWALNDAGRDAR